MIRLPTQFDRITPTLCDLICEQPLSLGGAGVVNSSSVPKLPADQPLERQMIILTAEVLAQCIEKDLVIRRGMRKQGHGGSKLEFVRIPEDLLNGSTLDLSCQLRALHQPRAKHRIL